MLLQEGLGGRPGGPEQPPGVGAAPQLQRPLRRPGAGAVVGGAGAGRGGEM